MALYNIAILARFILSPLVYIMMHSYIATYHVTKLCTITYVAS